MAAAEHPNITRDISEKTAWAVKYFKEMSSLQFFPNSPTFSGAGTPLGQLAACFVLAIDDDMGKKSSEGIFSTLRTAAWHNRRVEAWASTSRACGPKERL